jgi:hypothetical protein
MKKKKVVSRRAAAKKTDDGEYVKSPVVRVGTVFFFVMVIAVVAYAVKVYLP